MPVRRFEANVSTEHSDLVEHLAREWAAPAENTAEPLILEDYDKSNALRHIYVVWSRWRNIDRAERSEIIMDAVEKRYGRDKALEVAVAMGLEPDEARKMGLRI